MPMFARVNSLRDSLWRKPRLEQELDAELRVFVEELADRYADRGLTREAAEQAALAELGGMAIVKGRVRDAWIGNGIETTVGDARHAWRGLWRTPAFAAVTILTLGLGIGATTAIFSLVHALLLEDLPYRDARQLVIVWGDGSDIGYPRAAVRAGNRGPAAPFDTIQRLRRHLAEHRHAHQRGAGAAADWPGDPGILPRARLFVITIDRYSDA